MTSRTNFFAVGISKDHTAGMGRIKRHQSTKMPKTPLKMDIVLKLKNFFVTAASVKDSPDRGVANTSTMIEMVVKKMVEMVAPIVTLILTHRKGRNNW